MNLFTLCVALCATVIQVSAARADLILFDSFEGQSALPVDGSLLPHGYQAVAMQFEVPIGTLYSLSQLDVILVGGLPDSAVNVELLSDNLGDPGFVLESFTVTNIPDIQEYDLNSVSHPILFGGNSYWVAVLPVFDDTNAGWTTGLPRNAEVAINEGTGWNHIGTAEETALRVLVAAATVPEPSSTILLGLGGLAIAAAQRYRKVKRSD